MSFSDNKPRRSEEGSFQEKIPPFASQHIGAKAQQTQSYSSQAWARWEYSPQEWALFEKVDWKPARRKFWLSVALCFLLLPDLIVIISVPASVVFALCIVFLFVSVGFFVAAAIYKPIYDLAKPRHEARQQDGPHRVTLSEKGLWETGTYFPFDELSFGLDNVKMTPHPPVLHLRRIKHAGKASFSDTIRVPIPRGREEEAASVIQRFRKEVFEVREQARQRSMNPIRREPI